MKLYYHPLSTYSQKTLMAFYEKGVSFTPEIVSLMDPAGREAYLKINPLGKVPMLVLDDGWKIPESSIIIEYIDTHYETGTKLIPDDKDLARQTRFRDRMADLYIDDQMTTIFFDSRKPPAEKEPARVAKARATLDTMFQIIDQEIDNKTWAMGDFFSMADCAIAPPLGYCRQIHPFDKYANLTAYFNRLAQRPSYQRVLGEAAPYLAQFMQK